MGIIRSGGNIWVILENEDGESREVAVGDKFAGWTVNETDGNMVELKKDGRVITLTLQSESAPQKNEKSPRSAGRKTVKQSPKPEKIDNDIPEPLKIGKYTIPQVDD